ncbi:MAG: LptF/LptG family permease, partial [Chitinophagaceae bacterium]|nr:LptF/LptG family permease [Chitinophagaceae bacterium]
PGMQDNIIVANKGIMKVTPDQAFLVFTLKDGWRYEEHADRSSNQNEFIRLGFKEYKKVLDLSSLQLSLTSDSAYKDRYEMLSVRQLEMGIDTLEKHSRNFSKRVQKDLAPYLLFNKMIDSGWTKLPQQKWNIKKFSQIIPDSAKSAVLDQSISYTSSIRNALQITSTEFESQRKEKRLQLIEWHNKFTMAIAVLVLFMIGAPLGSIVRKGGIGTPVVFAVIFFVIFFLLNNFGKKFVQQDVLRPVAGMWLATFVLVPIGLFLIYKAMHDSQLLNKEFYFRAFRKVRALLSKKNASV